MEAEGTARSRSAATAMPSKPLPSPRPGYHAGSHASLGAARRGAGPEAVTAVQWEALTVVPSASNAPSAAGGRDGASRRSPARMPRRAGSRPGRKALVAGSLVSAGSLRVAGRGSATRLQLLTDRHIRAREAAAWIRGGVRRSVGAVWWLFGNSTPNPRAKSEWVAGSATRLPTAEEPTRRPFAHSAGGAAVLRLPGAEGGPFIPRPAPGNGQPAPTGGAAGGGAASAAPAGRGAIALSVGRCRPRCFAAQADQPPIARFKRLRSSLYPNARLAVVTPLHQGLSGCGSAHALRSNPRHCKALQARPTLRQPGPGVLAPLPHPPFLNAEVVHCVPSTASCPLCVA